MLVFFGAEEVTQYADLSSKGCFRFRFVSLRDVYEWDTILIKNDIVSNF